MNFVAENDIDGRNYKTIKLKSRIQKKHKLGRLSALDTKISQ